MRKVLPALVGNQFQLLPVDDGHILAYLRWHDASNLIVVANFSETPRSVDLSFLRQEGIAHFLRDVFTDETISTVNGYELGPYELLWLEED